MSRKQEVEALTRELKAQAWILGGFVSLMWVLEIIDQLFLKGALDAYGIRPRNLIGLRGILFMPLLHGGFGHLIANTIPFLTLGWFVMLREISDFFVVTAVTMLISGLGVWLIGASNSVHIGASGLVFGYLGFLLLRGYFERSVLAITISLTIGLFYGGLVWGVLPGMPGVSWEGHLFGFLGGALAANLLAKHHKNRGQKN